MLLAINEKMESEGDEYYQEAVVSHFLIGGYFLSVYPPEMIMFFHDVTSLSWESDP